MKYDQSKILLFASVLFVVAMFNLVILTGYVGAIADRLSEIKGLLKERKDT